MTLVAGAGAVIGSGGTDTLSGIENINGTNQADQITGDAFNNNLAGNGGNDIINGGAGDDYLTGGSGTDTLTGGAGNDRASYFDDGNDGAGPITQGINANLATGTIVDGWGDPDTLNSIENIEGTDLADQITGDALKNGLKGNGGNDIINGSTATTSSPAATANNTLIGGTGFDPADYFFTNQTTGIVANLVTGIVTGGGGTDTLSSIEYIRSTDLADTIVGDTADNAFWGNGGNDAMDGGLGFNVLVYGHATGRSTSILRPPPPTVPTGTTPSPTWKAPSAATSRTSSPVTQVTTTWSAAGATTSSMVAPAPTARRTAAQVATSASACSPTPRAAPMAWIR